MPFGGCVLMTAKYRDRDRFRVRVSNAFRRVCADDLWLNVLRAATSRVSNAFRRVCADDANILSRAWIHTVQSPMPFGGCVLMTCDQLVWNILKGAVSNAFRRVCADDAKVRAFGSDWVYSLQCLSAGVC